MPAKSTITLSEIVLILLVWGACQNAWRSVIIEGLNAAAKASFPGAHRYYQNLAVGVVLLAVLFALVLLTRNVDVGRYKVFELTDAPYKISG